MMREISFDEWIDDYNVVVDSHRLPIDYQFNRDVLHSTPPLNIWTEINDGIVSGLMVVDRVAVYISNEPHDGAMKIFIPDASDEEM